MAHENNDQPAGRCLAPSQGPGCFTNQPLAQYMEECLEQKLAHDESLDGTLKEWINSLPKVSPDAIGDFEKNISGDDFRTIDEDMWK